MYETSDGAARTILRQLGGNKFLVMTGAKDLGYTENQLSFRLPAAFARDGINYVSVTLDPSDTYTVQFFKIGRAPKFATSVVARYSDIYADQLRETFRRVTGLEVSLGTMGGA